MNFTLKGATCTYGCAFVVMVNHMCNEHIFVREAIAIFEGVLRLHHQPLLATMSSAHQQQVRHSVNGVVVPKISVPKAIYVAACGRGVQISCSRA